jgi:hypothetical protein
MLSKATSTLSSDARSKMLLVVDTSITCAKVNKQQLTSDEATRMWALVAAGNGLAARSAASSSSSRRHLLSQQDGQRSQEPAAATATHCDTKSGPCADAKPANSSTSTTAGDSSTSSSYWFGSAGSRYELFGPPASRHLLQSTPAYEAPAFLASAQAIADLLSSAASPGAGFLSGGDNGLFVSVANQLGRSYTNPTAVAVGPVLASTGGAAAATSGSNAVVSFSQPLTGSCVAEDGSLVANSSCRWV